MAKFEVIFIDGMTDIIEAKDIFEAERIAAEKYHKGVEEAFEINDDTRDN